MTPQNLNNIKTLKKRPNITISIDPITIEIIHCTLQTAANKISIILKKTTYNIMIYEMQNYCINIVDHEKWTISQNEGTLPIFLADLNVTVQDNIKIYDLENIHPDN